MKRKQIAKDELESIVKKCNSIADVLRELNIVVAGGNYSTVKNAIKKFNIDISHFNGQAWSKGKVMGPKRPIADYLSNKCKIGSFHLKKKLLQEKVFVKKCVNCGLEKWLENEIPLELHHIDGNSSNNKLSNLQLLCPNCHALTENYRGKAKKK